MLVDLTEEELRLLKFLVIAGVPDSATIPPILGKVTDEMREALLDKLRDAAKEEGTRTIN